MFIKFLMYMCLLINYVIGMIKDVGERRMKEMGVVVIEWVLIKFNNVVDGVVKGFGWDGVLVGIFVVNVMIMFNYCDVCFLFN